jgi:hypothetical protein
MRSTLQNTAKFYEWECNENIEGDSPVKFSAYSLLTEKPERDGVEIYVTYLEDELEKFRDNACSSDDFARSLITEIKDIRDIAIDFFTSQEKGMPLNIAARLIYAPRLRNMEWLIDSLCDAKIFNSKFMPKHKYIKLGYFEIIPGSLNESIKPSILVTPKGYMFIKNEMDLQLAEEDGVSNSLVNI